MQHPYPQSQQLCHFIISRRRQRSIWVSVEVGQPAVSNPRIRQTTTGQVVRLNVPQNSGPQQSRNQAASRWKDVLWKTENTQRSNRNEEEKYVTRFEAVVLSVRSRDQIRIKENMTARKNMAGNDQRYMQLIAVSKQQGHTMTLHREQIYVQMEETF